MRGRHDGPWAATIVRAQALDATREYVRFQDGEYRHLGADETEPPVCSAVSATRPCRRSTP